MARTLACRSPWRNPLPTGKNEIAGVASRPAPTNGSDTSTPAPAVSRIPTPAPPVAPIVASSPILPLAIPAPSLDNKLFKQFIKSYLEAKVPVQIALEIDSKPCKQPLKVRFPDLYYGNLHIDWYRFCQKCNDHFETIGDKRPNRILFAALFLSGLVTQQWLQHKQRRDGAVLMTWPEFKEILRKNLGNSRAFVDSVWKKIKRDS